MAATGTDAVFPTDAATLLPANRQQYSDETAQNEAKSCEFPPTGNDNADCPNVLKINEVSDNRRDAAEVVGARIELATHGFSVREQTPENIGKTTFSDAMGADAGAVETKNGRFPPDLQGIIDAWPALPEAIQAGILAIVAAASQAAR